jgi:hypothetical protein
MKPSIAFALAGGALVFGILIARWCPAQTSDASAKKEQPTYDFGALQQLTSFVSYLQDTKQTNTLQRFNDYMNASVASRNYADVGVTLGILQRLRDGRTNGAYELLEGQLDTAIIGFVGCYRELPVSAQRQPGLKVLQQARDYRAKFPFKHRYADVDTAVGDAFKVLDEKSAK